MTSELTSKWNKGELTTPKYIRALNEHAMSLKQRIEELEAMNSKQYRVICEYDEAIMLPLLSCEGCKHDKTNNHGSNLCQYEFNCIRQQCDYYEPKEIQ